MLRIAALCLITTFLVLADLSGSATPATTAADAPVNQLIRWLLDEDRQLRGLPFAEVIFDTTGKRVLPVNPKNEIDQRVMRQISVGLNCDFPRTAEGRVQRSGYPDLRIVDLASKRVFYLDPKLYVAGSRDSSFRAFYFEPKIGTNKVRDDTVHLVVGFEHEPREKNGAWKFIRWDLIDLAQFKVKLKAEFQGSNHDMYRPEAIVASGAN